MGKHGLPYVSGWRYIRCMGIRKLLRPTVILGVVVAAFVLVAWNHHRLVKPVTEIVLLGYTNLIHTAPKDINRAVIKDFKSEGLLAKVSWTNIGTTSLVYDMSPYTGSPYPSVRWQTPNGWVQTNEDGMTPTERILRPGESVVFPIWLPTNTIRWEFSFQASSASLRDRIGFRMDESKWYGLASELFTWESLNTKESIEVKSEMFEVGEVSSGQVQGK